MCIDCGLPVHFCFVEEAEEEEEEEVVVNKKRHNMVMAVRMRLHTLAAILSCSRVTLMFPLAMVIVSYEM